MNTIINPNTGERYSIFDGYFNNDLGFIVKIILNSLVNLYVKNIINLEKLVRKKFNKIHIIGGGTKNEYLIEKIKNKISKEIILYKKMNI